MKAKKPTKNKYVRRSTFHFLPSKLPNMHAPKPYVPYKYKTYKTIVEKPKLEAVSVV